jgi:hypothetical protein
MDSARRVSVITGTGRQPPSIPDGQQVLGILFSTKDDHRD